jgi:hypothetical protein
MSHESKMPERWYKLLRERMQIEKQRMRVIKDGSIIEDDHLQELLTEAHSLDREMLLVMRQVIAEDLAREDGSSPAGASSRMPLQKARRGVGRLSAAH